MYVLYVFSPCILQSDAVHAAHIIFPYLSQSANSYFRDSLRLRLFRILSPGHLEDAAHDANDSISARFSAGPGDEFQGVRKRFGCAVAENKVTNRLEEAAL
jgi:hypothetical protein